MGSQQTWGEEGWKDTNPSSSSDSFASAAARDLAAEHGLEEADLEGTGSGGKITVEDVKSAAE